MKNFAQTCRFEEVKEVAKESCDKFAKFTDTSFEKIEKIAALNLGTAHDLIESTLKNSKDSLDVKSPKELADFIKKIASDTYIRTSSYVKNLSEINTSTK